ncbi:helix-turn-helix transcriptional regulator [Streptomyces sp. NPDC045714]|uniref:helix-turn-helix domain-containing protein n=1 Tax=Streptomyces sp. NPDC045714 TaxID=3154913 RepID=UPI0033F71301
MYHEPLPPDRVRARRLQIADAIRAARIYTGYTQEEASIRAGISLDSYNRIEQGHASPKIDTLIKIADGLGVELEVFVRR